VVLPSIAANQIPPRSTLVAMTTKIVEKNGYNSIASCPGLPAL